MSHTAFVHNFFLETFGINQWFAIEVYEMYLKDKNLIQNKWKVLFDLILKNKKSIKNKYNNLEFFKINNLINKYRKKGFNLANSNPLFIKKKF